MYRKCSGWGCAFYLQLYGQVTFEQRYKRIEGRNHENIWEKEHSEQRRVSTKDIRQDQG